MDTLKTIGTVQAMKNYVDENYGTVDRTRMLARLVENQGLDAWMTHELMEKAVRKVEGLLTTEVMKMTKQSRDQQTSTTASPAFLDLHNTPVDSFFNFQSIRYNSNKKPFVRHQNRPDGMFMIELQGAKKMVLFYEGDVHEKDSGKSLDKGCTNSHKMYQYIAQAQSYSPESAGCAIFAAMLRASSTNFVGFLDDMLKAHIFACLLIVQYNLCITEQNKKSVLYDHVAKQTKQSNNAYDFVIGINIKTIATKFAYTIKNFEYKIKKMLDVIGKKGDKIELNGIDFNKQPAVPVLNLTYNSLEITILAIPRAHEDYLNGTADKTPAFVYPLHLHKIIQFDTVSARAVCQNNRINMLKITRAGTQQNDLTFEQHMMKKTRVNSVASSVSDWTCLDDTTGFFYVAIPLAYFTIELFETYVNAKWDYKWCNTSADFKQLLNNFKANLKDMPFRKIPVAMGKENRDSLFNVICKSTCATVDDVADDFKMFLGECCMWDIPEQQVLSPVVFFRTLGILSLQNAIDFACETKKNNKTYTALLSSYPIGTQILIQKCMQKLTENEAYVYIARPEVATIYETVDEQDASDVDDDGTSTMQKLGDAMMQEVKQQAENAVYASMWSVNVENLDVAAPNAATLSPIATALLQQYKEATTWKITKIDNEDNTLTKPKNAENEAWQKNFELINVNPSLEYKDVRMKDMTVVRGDFKYCISYNGIMYKCEATWPTSVRLPNKRINSKPKHNDTHAVTFGNVLLTFKCTAAKRVGARNWFHWILSFFTSNKDEQEKGTIDEEEEMYSSSSDDENS
jgi:hypothetical protein